MSYTREIKDLIAASYLSGAAEALVKSKEFSPDDLQKNIEDIKKLRRIFLNKSESNGYDNPVHYIEDAKLEAYKLLTQVTEFPKDESHDILSSLGNSFSSLFGQHDKPVTAESINALANHINMITTPAASQVIPFQETPPLANMVIGSTMGSTIGPTTMGSTLPMDSTMGSTIGPTMGSTMPFDSTMGSTLPSSTPTEASPSLATKLDTMLGGKKSKKSKKKLTLRF